VARKETKGNKNGTHGAHHVQNEKCLTSNVWQYKIQISTKIDSRSEKLKKRISIRTAIHKCDSITIRTVVLFVNLPVFPHKMLECQRLFI
jgi:hypothetical protein